MQPIEQQGILKKAIAGFYYVEAGDSLFECKARGIFRQQKIQPTVGDQVCFTVLPNGSGLLTKVLPRKNCLVRPPVANITRLFIVSAENTPAPNTQLIDRLTAIAVCNQIEPVLIFNKCDEGDLTPWAEIYQKSGFRVFVTSAKTGAGCKELLQLLQTGVSAFTGNSGVGKSSLLNAMLPQLNLQTGSVSQKLGRGRHTTRTVELFSVGQGYVVDTPGFSSLDIERTMPLFKEQLPAAFPEFEPFLGRCKFTSCAHIGEKGCAVCAAVLAGQIPSSRYRSYCNIYSEIKDKKPWNQK